MDFLTVMKQRRSCRSYDPGRPVSREDLLKIVEAGRLTPSACNSQPWKFLVIDSPEAKAGLCDAVVVENGMTGAPWRHQVPAFIVLVEQPADVKEVVVQHYHDTQHFARGDIGAACMNMMLAAHDLGLSSCVIGMNDQAKMEQHFGIPRGCEARLVLAIGYSTGEMPVNKIRKPLHEVCVFNHWQNAADGKDTGNA